MVNHGNGTDDAMEVEGPNSTWVTVARVGTEEEARLLQGFLEAEGIPSQVEVVRFNAEPVNFGDMSDVRVYVNEQNEPRASQLVREREVAAATMDEDGETVMTDEGPASLEGVDTTEREGS